jgi:hypothetical protein
MSTSGDKIIAEARARIIWGESALTVREFLISSGVSTEVAQAKVAEFEFERSRELRRIGLRNVLIGGVLTGTASITLYLAFGVASATSGIIKALAVVLLAGLYGLWKLLKGIAHLIRPQTEQRSVPDIEQSELIE